MRSRKVVVRNLKNGKKCPILTQSMPCHTRACPIDCQVSAWSKFNVCSKSCGHTGQKGFKKATRKITTKAAHGGKDCPAISKFVQCNTHKCPVDCQVGTWGEWGWTDTHYCSKKCGKGVQNRSRKIL